MILHQPFFQGLIYSVHDLTFTILSRFNKFSSWSYIHLSFKVLYIQFMMLHSPFFQGLIYSVHDVTFTILSRFNIFSSWSYIHYSVKFHIFRYWKIQKYLLRKPKMSNFIEYRDLQIVYKRYASLFFCFAIDREDNELGALEVIHR